MRKVEAAILAVLLVLAGVFLQIDGKADTNEPQSLEANKITLNPEKTPTSLEIGDSVQVQIKANNITGVSSIRGVFHYDKSCFKTLDNTDMEGGQNWLAVVSDDNITIQAVDENAEYTSQNANGILATITLTVKKAVQDKATFSLTDLAVNTDSQNYVQESNLTISTDVTNSMEGNRKLTLEMSDVHVHIGDVVKIPVRIKENTGFNAVGIRITYPDQIFENPSIELSDDMKAYVDCATKYSDGGAISLALVKAGNDFTKKDVDFFTINLDIKSDRSIGAGTGFPITMTLRTVQNVSHVPISGGDTEYSSNVVVDGKYKLGDVNKDGERDLLDATFVLQYYNGIREFDASEKYIADVNSSNSITLADVLLIMRDYNGENIIVDP